MEAGKSCCHTTQQNQEWATTRRPVAAWPQARTCENDAAGMSACVTGLVCPIWSDMHDILKSRSICSVKPARVASHDGEEQNGEWGGRESSCSMAQGGSRTQTR